MPRALIVLCVFLVVAESIALASSARKLSLEELARQADVIVKGHVEKLMKETSPDRAAITTIAVLAIDRQWKGPRAATLAIRQPGGSSGDITQRVVGAPTFAVDEKVIVFLKRESRSRYVTVGGRQGKFSVKADAQTGDEFVEDLTGSKQALETFLGRLNEALAR